MRRTYRSKKDAPDALNPRDVLSDSKTSVFDAFYIQNLKQTKREMSVGTFQFSASNRVRKRNNKKTVKRVKEREPSLKISPSKSTYLTPDKSIRVNKALDLFDQLLNSSPVEKHPSPILQISYHKKQKKPTRKVCNRIKLANQEYNCSSTDDTDSDKENSGSNGDITRNTSDIRKHQLIIEKEIQNSKNTNLSINNILNNLSLFKKSPINCLDGKECSPLCSTPMNNKYRGQSIYKFSPIVLNFEDSKERMILEEIEYNNASGENCNSLNTRKSIILNIPSNSINKNVPKEVNSKYNEVASKELLSKSESLINISEKPFIGFTNKTDCNIININKSGKQSSCSITEEKLNKTEAQNKSKLTIYNHILTNKESYMHLEEVNKPSKLNTSLNEVPNLDFTKYETDVSCCGEKSNENNEQISVLQNEESESLYDSCESNENLVLSDNKRYVVVIERLNNSLMQKYLSNINDSLIKDSESVHSKSSSLDSDDYNSSEVYDESQISDNKSKCFSSNASSIQNYENVNIEEKPNCNHSFIDKEECNVFVTKRRRNGVTNDSFILADNNSLSSFIENYDNTNYEKLENTMVNNKKLDNVVDTSCNMYIEDLNSSCKALEECTKINIDVVPFENIEFDLTEKANLKLKIDDDNLKDANNCDFSMICKEKDKETTEVQSITTRQRARLTRSTLNNLNNSSDFITNRNSECCGTLEDKKPGIVLKPGKQWERSLSIYRRMSVMSDQYSILEQENLETKGRKYRQSVISTIEMQNYTNSDHNVSINSRRSTFVSKPSRSTISIIKDFNTSKNSSVCSTSICNDLQGFWSEDCDDTVIELSKLSIADCEDEITILEKFDDTSNHHITARDYVLRRCNQAEVILFDECYPDTVLKNCRKIGEGVYGEVFLWRARDGRARVLKIIPIAGNVKVNGEDQKDYSEIISEIVIAMELSALRAPIAEIEQHLDEGKNIDTLDLQSIENATDIFNEVLAVQCVRGPYPARLLDLWELYDESRGSENDNPATLPVDQTYLVLELANAGQDLEGYTFTNAEQAYSVLQQVAFGLAVAEEAYQFEHRDLHWGNVLIAPTEQKFATFVLRGRLCRVSRRGVAATVIDYSLSRLALRAPRGTDAALYNDLAADEGLFDAVGDYQFDIYRLMRHKLGNDWKNFEPYTNILWLHYTVDKMITALRYSRTNTKIHKHYISKLKEVKNRILNYESATQFVLTDNEL